NTLVAVTFIQFIQVLCVVIGTQIIPLLQTGDDTLVIVRLLVSVGILYLAVTIPRYFQQAALHAIQAAHSQFWGGMTNAVRSVGSVAGLVVRGFL
ncbi:MAG TPA: hypothetical protein VH593_14995, partial [Ktedonobacteraceae bacterium]